MARHFTFHYTLRDAQGQVLDTSRGDEPLTCVEGAEQIVPGLEQALRGMAEGERRDVIVPCEQAYGLRDQDLVQRVPRERLPIEGELAVGDQFRTGPDRHAPIVTVVGLEGTDVILDANHPLAGEALHFDVELVEVRAATADEVKAARQQN